MWAMSASHGICYARVISIAVFICSVRFPAKGLLPSVFCSSVLQPRSGLGMGSQWVSPLLPQQAGGRRLSKFRLNFTLQIPDLQWKVCYCFHWESQAQLWLVPGARPLEWCFPSQHKGKALCLCPSHSLQNPMICFNFSICVTEIKQFAYHCRAVGGGWVESTPNPALTLLQP